jgi:hypothetical protein
MKGGPVKKRIAILATTLALGISSPALAISSSPLRAQPQPSTKSQPVKKSKRSPRMASASGFNPSVNGFSFANWQSGSLSEETSISLLIQLFGEQSICQTVSVDHSCTPYPKAKAFSQQFADTIAFGRCEGMVVLASSLYASGKPAAGLSQQAVDSSILYWWASQILPSVTAASESSKQLAPTELLPLIANGIANGSSSTLGLYFQGLGHTLLPIKQMQNGNVVTVDVYDSNTPNTTQHVLINTAKNSWSYTAVDSSGNTVMNWTGIGAGTLDVVPMSARQPQATSYFAQ